LCAIDTKIAGDCRNRRLASAKLLKVGTKNLAQLRGIGRVLAPFNGRFQFSKDLLILNLF
jgi:hypothetical protein